MRNLLAYGVIAVAGLSAAACGGDDKNSDGTGDGASIDAPVAVDAKAIDAAPDSPTIDAAEESYDFTCAANPAPTTAPATITVSGTTEELTFNGLVPLGATTVKVVGSNGATLSSLVTGDTGVYTTDAITTGGTPFTGSLSATHADRGADMFRRTALFPPTALNASATGINTFLVTAGNFALLGNFAGQTQDDTVNGAIVVAVFDCAGAQMSGVTLSIKQNGVDVGSVFDLGVVSPMAKGLYLVYNVPPGNTVVGASYFAHTLLAHTVVTYKADAEAPNGTTTTTLLTPGYANP